MTRRTYLLPLVVALGVSVLTAWAVRSPLEDAPALRSRIMDDLDPIVEQVDRQFETLWRAQGLSPAPAVEDELMILRRLSLALHGTIPSLEEIRAFEADRRPERLRRWTTSLLEDTRFADYFADRLSRAFVGVEDGQFILFRRDRFNEWLSQQLRQHRPYDQIVAQIITGKGVWTGDPEANFLTAAYANEQFDRNKLAGRTVRAFLGQRIDCAQCHDHPFSHWKQSEFEGLAAHFSELQVSLVGIEDQPGLRFSAAARHASKLQPGPVPSDVRSVLQQHKFVIPEQAEIQPAGGSSGPQWAFVVPPVDDKDAADIRAVARVEGNVIRVYDAAREHVIDEQGLIRVAPPDVPFGREWLPQQGMRRERLAAWVTHPQNRRFERAIANRVWGLMFGVPFHVDAAVDDLPDPDDPGSAELLRVLDLLGADFRAHGCDLRRLVQVIAASRPFRLASTHPLQAVLDEGAPLTDESRRQLAETVEALERHWAIFPLVRLRPEQFIGAMLQASHLTTIDRNSHLLVRAQRFFRERDFVREFGDPGEAELERRVGTIPQALLRMNGEFSRELSKAGPFSAPGRIAGFSPDAAHCLETTFLVCLARRPTAVERDRFLPQLHDADQPGRQIVMQDLFWTLFNSAEFSWNH